MDEHDRFGVAEKEGQLIIGDGTYVDAFNPSDVDIKVIAHSLSNICRYNGHCREFYSVAQHSLFVSLQFDDQRLGLAGLLHDASEAILGDMIRPLKLLQSFSLYRTIEEGWQQHIFKQFGLDPEMPEEIKIVDNRVLVTELRDLFLKLPDDLRNIGVPYEFRVCPLSPRAAEDLFMLRFHDLCVDARV